MAEEVKLQDRYYAWFLQNPECGLRDVAAHFGESYEAIKARSKNERWFIRRQIHLITSGMPEDAQEQARTIRTIIFSRIVNSGEEMSPKELQELVKTWLDVMPHSRVFEEEETFDRDSLLDETN